MNIYIPLSTALKESVKHYSFKLFLRDFAAALVVSLVALPLSMALAIAVGLPPQHGIYTAIVAGILVPLLGGSLSQVSGPTAAFVVILAPIVSEYGLHGLIWCQILAGIMLIIMGCARMGQLIRFVPYPVTTGFTSGIAVVLATLSLNDFLGLGIEKLRGEYITIVTTITRHLGQIDPYETATGVTALLVILVCSRYVRFLPAPIIGIVSSSLLGHYFITKGHTITTIGSRFHYTTADGSVLPGIPPTPPSLHFPTLDPGSLFTLPSLAELQIYILPAFVIAALAALESLLSATVADNLAGTKHHPDAELNGIGIGNIISGLAAGIPATGAIARTATNINNGGKTVFSASLHGALIMVHVVVFAPYISYIPMSSLAALLLITAYRMSHAKQFFSSIIIAPRSDTIVLLVCFSLTVFVDMVWGVAVGMVLASLLLIKHVSNLTQTVVTSSLSPAEHVTGQPPLPEGTMLYRITGPLFFGTAEKAYDRYQFAHDFVNRLIIDMRDVPFIDMTGMMALTSMVKAITREGKTVVICCSPSIRKRILYRLGEHTNMARIKIASSLNEALAAS